MTEFIQKAAIPSSSARWIAVARGSRFSSAQNSLLENTFVARGERSSKSSFSFSMPTVASRATCRPSWPDPDPP